MPEISVILPVYNVAAYLRTCLDTLLNQTFQRIEMICVDDGSTDGSGTILDEYASRDSRIRVFHQANAGAGAARNRGLDEAVGHYLYFCDPDDYLELTALARLHDCAERETADICVCRYVRFDSETGTALSESSFGHGLERVLASGKRTVIPGEFEGNVFLMASYSPWNKLFRREFVLRLKLRFQEIRRTNDMFFVATALAHAARITAVDEVLYHYRKGIDSVTAKAGLSDSFCDALVALKSRLSADGLYERQKGSFAWVAVNSAVANVATCSDPGAIRTLYPRIRKTILALVDGPSGLDEYLSAAYRAMETSDDPLFLLRVILDGRTDAMTSLRQRNQALLQRNLLLLKRNQVVLRNLDLALTRKHALQAETAELKRNMRRVRELLREQKVRLAQIQSSASYRIGRWMTGPFRLFRRSGGRSK